MSTLSLAPFAKRSERLRTSTIRELLKLTESRDILSLAGGLPSPDSFPMLELRREADRLFIIEDDPYGAIRFRGDDVSPIALFTDRSTVGVQP